MQTVVDLSRLRHNVRTIRSLTRNGFCAVVKADAYGHGIALTRYIEPLVDCFMVANADEAYRLLALVDKPILTIGCDISPFLRTYQPQIVPTVCDAKQLCAIVGAGYRRFSVEIDTGMNRTGARGERLDGIISFCRSNGIAPATVFSHIYGGLSSVPEQSAEFERATSDGIFANSKRHLYSSVALDLIGFDLYDMTRVGIAMYGYCKQTEICMKARAKIVAVNRVERGSHVGYGDHTLDRSATLATVACGYADGLRRCDRQLYLTVRGAKCPIVGVPCMDMCMIDVTGVGARAGDYAYLIAQKSDAEYLAKCYGTIVYEVLTSLNGRAERIYV